MSTRAEQRRLRQLEIENEQRLEDVEALKMTEEQRDILLRSFRSVKCEFHDLDGLAWTDSIRQQLKQPEDMPTIVSLHEEQQQDHSFVVLSKAELASFSPEETIRISAARRSCFPPPQQQYHEAVPPIEYSNFVTPVLRRGKRDGTRARSPIKGLFAVSVDSGTSPVDHCNGRNGGDDWIATEKFDDQATLRMRESPFAVTSSDHLAKDSRSLSSAPPTNSSPVSPRLPPPPPPPPQTMTNTTGAGIITSIFRSPVFTVPKGRMSKSQTQCSLVSTPKSSPSLASICSFSSA